MTFSGSMRSRLRKRQLITRILHIWLFWNQVVLCPFLQKHSFTSHCGSMVYCILQLICCYILKQASRKIGKKHNFKLQTVVMPPTHGHKQCLELQDGSLKSLLKMWCNEILIIPSFVFCLLFCDKHCQAVPEPHT